MKISPIAKYTKAVFITAELLAELSIQKAFKEAEIEHASNPYYLYAIGECARSNTIKSVYQTARLELKKAFGSFGVESFNRILEFSHQRAVKTEKECLEKGLSRKIAETSAYLARLSAMESFPG